MPETPHDRIRFTHALFLALVSFGLLLRLAFYLYPRTLWLDESMIALNFRESFGFLFHGELQYYQRAPVGWLIMEKVIFDQFGHSALALRFPSLIAASAGFVLLADAARRFLPPGTALSIVAFAAVAPLPIYYGAEVKHYAFDFLAAAFIAWILVCANDWKSQRRLVVTFNLVAGLASFFAFPFVFYAVPAQVALALRPDTWKRRVRLLLKLSLWMPAFLLSYLWSATRYDALRNSELKTFWAEGFWPLFSFDMSALTWPGIWAMGLFARLIHFPILSAIASLLVVAGAVVLIHRRDRVGLAFAATIALVMVASIAGLYPPVGRLAIFLYPALFLLLGAGLGKVATFSANGSITALVLGWGLSLVALIHCGALIANGSIDAGRSGSRPNGFEDIRAGIRLARERSPADARFLIPRFTIPAYAFHHSRDFIPPENVWLERVAPFSERGDVSTNWQFIVWHDDARFSNRDTDGTWTLSPAMDEFLAETATNQTPIALVVTHGHWEFFELADRLAGTAGPYEQIAFKGGLIFFFQPGP